MPVIETAALTHIYARGTPLETVSLQDVTVSISEGEFVAVIGPAGSGKSTLAQHFNGLLVPTRGSVLVAGRDTRDKRFRRELWRLVGLVFQYPERQFFEETVQDEVAFGLKNAGFRGRELLRRVREALEQVGLSYEEIKDRSPFVLSGGQRRRVAIASVLALDPQVLVLDEPAAGLDPAGHGELLRLLINWQRERGKTVILITHCMEDAACLADRVLVLYRGRLLKQGSPAEVFARPDEIKGIGLEMPFPTDLMHRLREAGKDVYTAVFTLEQAEAEIRRAIQGESCRCSREL